MRQSLEICVAQMNSTNAHAGNIETARGMIAAAAAHGADLVCLPEAANMMQRDREKAARIIRPERDDPFLDACRDLAHAHGLWIHTGSLALREDGAERFTNRSFVIDPTGDIRARYDKIHLFDVDLPDGIRRRESERYAPGRQAVLVDTPWGPWGLSICYDIRFPALYRDYAKAGATILFAPSAFALVTGEGHWETLLRARAIENGCFMVAAAQAGDHDDGRQTWGHSMIVDPWGRVIADAGRQPGLTFATLDLASVERTRGMIPSLANERAYEHAGPATEQRQTAGG